MLDLEDPQLLRSILDNLQVGLYVSDREHRIVFWNDGAERITGYMRHSVIGHVCCRTGQAGHGKKVCPFCATDSPKETLRVGAVVDSQIYLQHKAGYMIPVHARAVPIRDMQRSVAGILRIFEERPSVAETSQKNLANHGCLDLLSGVPNHRFTEFHLRESLLSFAQYHLPFGILCIAIDGIARVQATYGREATYVMLHMVAQTARHVLGPSVFLGRWGENEFIGIVLNCDRVELDERGAELQQVASDAQITWWDDRVSVKIRLTKAMVRPGDTLETLLERAERRFDTQHQAGEPSAQTLREAGNQSAKG